jgi:hypothetical protein
VTVTSVDDLRALIREVPDFPKPGIRFYDITTLLKEPDAFREVIDRMAGQIGDTKVDVVVGMESRGFIFSAPLAYKLGAGFVPVRKLGKLPAETIEVEYELEYGTATLEIHADAIAIFSPRAGPSWARSSSSGASVARSRASRSWSSSARSTGVRTSMSSRSTPCSPTDRAPRRGTHGGRIHLPLSRSSRRRP